MYTRISFREMNYSGVNASKPSPVLICS